MPLDSSFQITGSQIDSSGEPSDKILANIPYDSTRGKSNVSVLADNAPHALVLPMPVTYQVYIHNLDPAQSLTVNWTPVGQAQDLGAVLAPDSFILLWDVVGGLGGVTGVTVTASVGNCAFESFLGA